MTYNIRNGCGALAALALAFAQPGFAQAPVSPGNTISCDGFTKLKNGNWYAKADNPAFDLGTARQVTVNNQEVSPRSISVGGQELYTAVEAKCAKH